jgi:hypothetical protein
MDGSALLHASGWLALAWVCVSVVATAGLAIFMQGARRRDQDVPHDAQALRVWVLGSSEQNTIDRERWRRRRQPPAA